MNPSERLHNQGNNEQVMTPELKLSMELRATCERVIQEKGRNGINYSELFFQVLQPIGIIRSLVHKTAPHNMVRCRGVRLRGETSSDQDGAIECKGTNPSRAKVVYVYIKDMQGQQFIEGTDITTLSLERGKRGQIIESHLLNYHFFDNNAPKQIEKRLATMEELETYKIYIEQSLPVENK